MMFGYPLLESILIFRIDFKRNEKILILSESLLDKLSNINYFTSKLILTKSIPIKSILPRINFTKVKLNTS